MIKYSFFIIILHSVFKVYLDAYDHQLPHVPLFPRIFTPIHYPASLWVADLGKPKSKAPITNKHDLLNFSPFDKCSHSFDAPISNRREHVLVFARQFKSRLCARTVVDRTGVYMMLITLKFQRRPRWGDDTVNGPAF